MNQKLMVLQSVVPNEISQDAVGVQKVVLVEQPFYANDLSLGDRIEVVGEIFTLDGDAYVNAGGSRTDAWVLHHQFSGIGDGLESAPVHVEANSLGRFKYGYYPDPIPDPSGTMWGWDANNGITMSNNTSLTEIGQLGCSDSPTRVGGAYAEEVWVNGWVLVIKVTLPAVAGVLTRATWWMQVRVHKKV